MNKMLVAIFDSEVVAAGLRQLLAIGGEADFFAELFDQRHAQTHNKKAESHRPPRLLRRPSRFMWLLWL